MKTRSPLSFSGLILNLWVVAPSGVMCQEACISDIYIIIDNSGEITVMKKQRKHCMAGSPHTRKTGNHCSPSYLLYRLQYHAQFEAESSDGYNPRRGSVTLPSLYANERT